MHVATLPGLHSRSPLSHVEIPVRVSRMESEHGQFLETFKTVKPRDLQVTRLVVHLQTCLPNTTYLAACQTYTPYRKRTGLVSEASS